MSFQQEYDATTATTEDFKLPGHSRSFKQQPVLGSKQSSHFVETRFIVTNVTKVLANCDFVASRSSVKETCADMDRETGVSSLLGSASQEKRDRDQNVVQTLRLERNAEVAVRGENGSSKNIRS